MAGKKGGGGQFACNPMKANRGLWAAPAKEQKEEGAEEAEEEGRRCVGNNLYNVIQT